MARHISDHRQLSINDQLSCERQSKAARSRGCARYCASVLLSDANVFRLCKEAQRLLAAFAADAALFHSTKRNAQVAQKPAIHPNCAGVDLLCDTMGATQVLCPDARRQAVVTIVGVRNHF